MCRWKLSFEKKRQKKGNRKYSAEEIKDLIGLNREKGSVMRLRWIYKRQ